MFDIMNIVRKHKNLQKNEGQARKSETVHTTLKWLDLKEASEVGFEWSNGFHLQATYFTCVVSLNS